MWMAPRSQATEAIRMRGYRAYQYVFMISMNIYFTEILTLYIISDSQSIQTYIHHTPLCTLHIHNLLVTILYTLSQMSVNFWCLFAGLGSIPFFQFNSNSVISNSNSTTHKKFQFQFQLNSGDFNSNSNSGDFKSNLNSRNDLLKSSVKFITIIITR